MRPRARKAISGICAAAIALSLAASPSVAEAAFGFESASVSINSAPPPGAEPGEVGPPQLEAGSHPYQMKLAFAFNRTTNSEGETTPDKSLKDLHLDLPPGMVGNATAIPQCSREEFVGAELLVAGCPAASQVGTMTLETTLLKATLPVFNLEPLPDHLAQFGVFVLFSPIVMNVVVRTDGDYGLTMDLDNLSQFAPMLGGSVNLWGVPADERHDTLRGECLGLGGASLGSCPSGVSRHALLTLPGNCGTAPQMVLRMDSWERPGEFVSTRVEPLDGEGHPLPFHGCDALDFRPDLEIRPESRIADSPSGLGVDLRLPQKESPDGNAEAVMRSAVLELPEGLSLNPAAGDGLGACSPQQIALESVAAPSCPDSSHIGSATVDSPLVAEPLRGSIYLAAPPPGTFDGVFLVYLVAAGNGTQIKIPARIEADDVTGRLSVHLDELPQLPFSDFQLRFDGGPRAPFALPPRCGPFTSSALLSSYASPVGAAPSAVSSSFTVDRDCGGGFSPSFLGGATSAIAGRQTGLTLRLARGDGEQELDSFSTTLPRGMLPLLEGVANCPEAQAGAGDCPATSRIGTVTVTAGAGSSPLALAGSAYLTDPYKGAPFGLAIKIPAAAGPFDLGLVVVRARVLVDPRSARLTIATDPLPRILNGIPLRLRSFELSTTERGLFSTPTFCGRQDLDGEAVGGAGTVASLSTPFFLGDCGALRFAARISAVTEARASRGEGASLRVAIDSRRNSDANLRSFTLGFPRQFSPRLSAIQGACPASAFAAGPSQCPATAKIGSVRFDTQFFETPLTGSAYLVSRGSDALPRIVLDITTRGVKFEIVGTLHVSKQGKSSVTFAGMPDARSSRFVVNLPSGPDSALGATFLEGAEGSFCGRPMTLATKLVSYNGRRSKGAVRVRVAGCEKAGR
jgi:hypothetical protein